MIHKHHSLLLVLSLLLFGILSGCSAGESGQSTGKQVSDLTELSYTSKLIQASAGGEITHKNMTITIPPGSLAEDAEIKIALVSITRDGSVQSGGLCYKISGKSATEDVLELDGSATVTVNTSAISGIPSLYLWEGDDWINPEASYDGVHQTLTFQIAFIYRDGDEWTLEDGELEGPAVIQVVAANPANNMVHAQVQTVVASRSHIFSANKRFRLEFVESDRDFAVKVAADLEAGYDYYVNQLHLMEPAKFMIVGNDGTSVHSYIFVRITQKSSGDDEAGTAYVDAKGILDIPTTLPDRNAARVASLHELFHLVEYAYSQRAHWEDWYSESETESISTRAANVISGNADFFDANTTDSFFPKQKGFIHALDKFNDTEVYHYQNGIFWSYVMETHGMDKFTSFLKNVPKHDLPWLDGACKEILHYPLAVIYANAYEDYYAYGKFFNNIHFYGMASRVEGQPYFNERQNAFSEQNPYAGGKTIELERLSGRNVFISSATTAGAAPVAGSLNIKVSVKSSGSIKVKLFYFKYADGIYTFKGMEEMIGNKTMDDFGSKITDVLVVMENLSLNDAGRLVLEAAAEL